MDKFEKINSKKIQGLFFSEAKGISEINSGYKEFHLLKTPEIFLASEEKIVMERINAQAPTKSFWSSLGTELANMHRLMANVQFGYEEDNFIGNNPQCNSWEVEWTSFFMKNRLLFQINLIENKFHKGALSRLFLEKSGHIEEILNSVEVRPTLVHGDLWNGNVLCGEDESPYLIDPAVYYGHSEVDMAMTTLFGGFEKDFYEAYELVLPFEKGYKKRFELYNLYHVLNHFNLFGGSYYNHAIQIFEKL